MHGVLQPLFEPLGMAVDALELTGRGGWRATLDTGAALELEAARNKKWCNARSASSAH